MCQKREWDTDTIGRVFGIMNEILYSIALYQAINPRERNNEIFEPDLRNFWIMISNNSIQMAIINWCKIFGSVKNNRTHFSHFIDSASFEEKMKTNGIQFNELQDSMLNVRDKFSAHEDSIEKRKKIPEFDDAIRIMELFTDSVQNEYDIPLLSSIKSVYKTFQLQIYKCLQRCEIDWELPKLQD